MLYEVITQGAAEVHCLYRRDRDNMPGSQREVENAIVITSYSIHYTKLYEVLTSLLSGAALAAAASAPLTASAEDRHAPVVHVDEWRVTGRHAQQVPGVANP